MKTKTHVPLAALMTALALSLSSVSVNADSTDTFNFRFSPVPLVIGLVGVNLDVKIADQWTLGPQLSLWHLSMNNGSGATRHIGVDEFGLGARGNWFKNGVYTDGLYVGTALNYVTARISTTNSNDETNEGRSSALVASGLVGYGWFWKSFNMMLGAGLTVPIAGHHEVTVTDSAGNQTKHDTSPTGGLALEYSLGWTF